MKAVRSLKLDTMLERHRRRDSVEKLFLSSKSFLGTESLRIHSMETLRVFSL